MGIPFQGQGIPILMEYTFHFYHYLGGFFVRHNWNTATTY